jgi:hypothetical protein
MKNKILILLGVLLLTLFLSHLLVFITWMNVTPGHFERCGGYVDYVENEELPNVCLDIEAPRSTLKIVNLVMFYSLLDFNR